MKLIGILAALLLVIGAAVALGNSDDSDPGAGGTFALGDVRLVSVESCDELLDWYQTAASDQDAAFLSGFGYAVGGDVAVAAREEAPAADGDDAQSGAAPAPTSTGAADQSGYSGTNVQERDVDEPDVVKTNGDIIISAGFGGLRIVDVGGGAPRLLSTLALEEGSGELLLRGDRLLVLTNAWRPSEPDAGRDPASGAASAERTMIAPAGTQVTVLTAVDISDPANPVVVETREIPGTYRSARVMGTAARIVVVNHPQIPQPGPAVFESGDPEDVEARLAEWNDDVVSSMTLEDWSPAVGDDCSSVARTTAPEGVSTTTVLTLDLQGSLQELDRDSVVADAGTIYASTDRLVIATSRWQQWSNPEGDTTTELHAFDITDPAQTTYIGSGEVAGYLLNQFALSEHQGNLRVATTEDAPWDETTGTAQTDSGITVLDGAMQQIGRIDGLGVTEQIRAVRYIGDVAYVVTFRQTDPLYTIDLADPTAPRVAGELKIPGYSAYLHPIDEGRLLGVGQDATEEGRLLGTQVSTFDVSDPAAAVQIDKLSIENGSSAVEWDHRAFLWWATTRSAVLPLEIYSHVGIVDCPTDADCQAPPEQQPYAGAAIFDIGDDGSITEQGRVAHHAHAEPNGAWPAIQRSIVVGDALYTISEAGLLRSDLGSLADEGWVPFPAPDLRDRPIPVEG